MLFFSAKNHTHWLFNFDLIVFKDMKDGLKMLTQMNSWVSFPRMKFADKAKKKFADRKYNACCSAAWVICLDYLA